MVSLFYIFCKELVYFLQKLIDKHTYTQYNNTVNTFQYRKIL